MPVPDLSIIERWRRCRPRNPLLDFRVDPADPAAGQTDRACGAGREIQNTATNEGAAVSRALKEYRKDVRARGGRGKRIEVFDITVRRERRSADGEGD